MKLRLLLPLVLLLPGAAHATQAPVMYHYGMPLDIARVLDIREPTGDQQCKVVTATMTYLDSHGQERQLDYLALSKTCSDQG